MNRTLAALPVALLAISCTTHKAAENPPPAPAPVRLGVPTRIETAASISLSGTVVSPDNPASVAFLVSGRVQSVGPREGDRVTAGSVLATLDPVDYRLAAELAAAQVAGARAALAKAEAPARPELLEQARIAYERAEDEYRRMKQLFDSRSLPANDFAKFEAARNATRQQWEQARFGGQKEDRAQAAAAVEQAQAAERVARQHIIDTTLRSPLTGFISARLIEPGEIAGPGRPAFQIVVLDPVEINVGVPETDIQRVRVGQSAELRLPALPGESFTGTVRVINVAADPSTRTYMTRLRVPNPQHRLRLGMIAESRILGSERVEVFTLPAEAIFRDPQGASIVYIYFPDQKRVHARRVSTGSVRGREIEIISGLTGAEQVVVAGQERLRDGMAVTPEGR